MALRAVPEHPKFAKLKKELGISKFEALGLLETLWHFVGKFSPRGNVGRFSDSDIEAWMEWTGEPGTAVAALTASGWLDESAEHRLVVHDWHNHADSTTKKQVGRTGPRQGGFVSDMSEPTPTEQVNVQVIPQETRPPEPVPVPVPVPVPDPDKKQAIALVERTFDFYCLTFKRNPKVYSLTQDRRKKAALRVRERLAIHEGDLAAVEADFKRVVLNLAASEFHREKGYLDWTDQIFRSQEEFEKRLNWKKQGVGGSGVNQGETDTSAPRFASFNALRAKIAEAEAQLGNQ